MGQTQLKRTTITSEAHSPTKGQSIWARIIQQTLKEHKCKSDTTKDEALQPQRIPTSLRLADSPLCDCKNGQETVEHFLLECPLYRTQRMELRDMVGTGNMRMDALLGTWEVIIKGTEKYINETERFQN